MSKLNKAQAREFLDLVADVNSSSNKRRVVGRLQMRTFIDKHGREACDEFYAAFNGKLNEREKKK